MAVIGLNTLEDFAHFFSQTTRIEAEALRSLPWQAEPLIGEAVAAKFDPEMGLIAMIGAMPFLETLKAITKPAGEGWQYLKSEALGHFLVENRALFRAYTQAAHREKCSIVGDYSPAYLVQVTTGIGGMEAANFAIFLASQIQQQRSGRTLLIDADPQNQFLFPLLKFPQIPHVLTEHLQKPSSFRADLEKCILPLAKDFDYLNLQASSLRPFNDDELPRILGFLDADFENIIVYSGKLRSSWLSTNAHINFAVGESNLRGESASLLRHRAGSHTVLIAKGKERFFPCLTTEFSDKSSLDFWISPPTELAALRNFVRRLTGTNRLAIGGSGKNSGFLACHTGLSLYLRFSGSEEMDAGAAVARLQNKLRAYYPKSAFFGTRSIYRHVSTLPKTAATTLLEVGDYPQMVSLLQSKELRSAAIFPAGILRPLAIDGVRISACSADGLLEFRDRAQRAGIDRVISVPKFKLQNPNALGAIMEQVQA